MYKRNLIYWVGAYFLAAGLVVLSGTRVAVAGQTTSVSKAATIKVVTEADAEAITKATTKATAKADAEAPKVAAVTEAATELNISTKKIEKEFKFDDGTTYYEYSIEYPVIQDAGDACDSMNAEIMKLVKKMEKGMKKGEADAKSSKKEYPEINGYSSDDVTVKVEYNQDGILSLLFTGYVYSHGAAHGSPYFTTFTFDTATGKKLSITDVTGKSMADVKKEIVAGVKKLKAEDEDGMLGELKTKYIKECMKKQMKRFYVTDKGVVYFFNVYELAPYAYGTPEVVLGRTL